MREPRQVRKCKALLLELIKEARDKGMWIKVVYSNVWFSPDWLEAAVSRGDMLWGSSNFILSDPEELRRSHEQLIKDLQEDLRFLASGSGRIEG